MFGHSAACGIAFFPSLEAEKEDGRIIGFDL